MKQLILLLAVLHFTVARSQFTPNYDESKIPEYTLPKILVDSKGKEVKSIKTWEKSRRPEILSLFENQMFGTSPTSGFSIASQVTKDNILTAEGNALIKEVVIMIKTDKGQLPLYLLMFTPKNTKGPVPCMLAPNFQGNHTVHPNPNITLAKGWVRNNEAIGVTENKSVEKSRGMVANRWDVDAIISHGYALATYYYGDIDPDFDDGFRNGLQPLFYEDGQTSPQPNEWGSIAAWAFGLSRAMDYLVTDPSIDRKKVAVMGHSRLGKTALWAGATDTRFALVISNDSGCGGAALSRRRIGETVGRINTAFPHWFCDNFVRYNDNESALPFDQHMLLALVAPRPLYVASAEEDNWADQKGEFLSLYNAGPVFELYGDQAINNPEMPKVDQPLVVGKTGYHIRSGGHDVKSYDWEQYLNFADRYFK